MRGPRVAAALTTAALFGPACGTTATLKRSVGPNYEATIERSDEEALYVRGDNGALFRIPRQEVHEIDHPGNVTLSVGLGLLAAALALSGAVAADNDQNAAETATALALVYGVPGAALAFTGGFTWYKSRGAARAFERARLSPIPTSDWDRRPPVQRQPGPSPWGVPLGPAPRSPPPASGTLRAPEAGTAPASGAAPPAAPLPTPGAPPSGAPAPPAPPPAPPAR